MNLVFFKITLRNILHQKLISAITIAGLAAGLAGCMFIYLWIADELGYDRFNKLGSRLYRVEEDQVYDKGDYHVSVTPWPSGPVWRDKIPEIENSCRMAFTGGVLIRNGEKIFNERNVIAVDSTFFRMFTCQIVAGDIRTILKDPRSIVLTREMAIKYFGNEDPIGKSLVLNSTEVFQVGGVMKKLPSNSTIAADFLLPFDYMKNTRWYTDNWSTNSIYTFVLLAKGSKVQDVNLKLTAVVKEHVPEITTKYMLFPLLRIHLHGYGGFVHRSTGTINVIIFASIAILVLVIACINFMNVSTSRALSRAKETSLYKLNGASRGDLVIHFLGESFIYTVISMLFGLLLVGSLLNVFNFVSGKTFSLADLFSTSFISGAIIIALLTTLIAGSYPAIILSSFKPVEIFKAGTTGGKAQGLFRKTSVVLQFSVSLILILFAIVAFRQLRFMLEKPLGFDRKNLVYIRMRDSMTEKYPMIKQELMKDPEVMSVSAASNTPDNIGNNADNIWWEGKSPEMKTLVSMAGIDFDYIETTGIKLKSGRSFSRDYSIDIPHDSSGTFLINEQLEKLMGPGDATGKQLKFGGTRGEIVGVMKDFNFESLQSRVGPLALWIWQQKYFGYIFIRLKPGDLKSSLAALEKTWKRIMPDNPFEYQFLDDTIKLTYRSEEQSGALLRNFSILAIFIACIGLFGLATYTVERKMREIGIRKALGASVLSIFTLIGLEFLILLVIAMVISVPVSVVMMHRYLGNYGYHIDLGAGIYLMGVLFLFATAAAAVGYQLFHAARTNPAESLKYE